MRPYASLSKPELAALKDELLTAYEQVKQKGYKLNMSRGVPGADQLDICEGMLTALETNRDCIADNVDVRSYGLLDGLPECKRLFIPLFSVTEDEMILGGNSSLNMMYDAIARAYCFGVLGGDASWGAQGKIKFLCPVPGYDRHFSICQLFGIEMIPVEMRPDGPDMDSIERLVSEDAAIKGIWCVPKYSNPDGTVYSDQVIRRFARLKPAAKDFRIFWDNAYCVHHLTEEEVVIPSLLRLCEEAGNPHMVFEFMSTSKISYPGGGVAFMVASKENIAHQKKLLSIQTIGPDKVNQLRHVRYFKNVDGIRAHMEKHGALLRPKFDCVISTLERDLAGLDIAWWNKPKGGYFITLDVLDGCAKRVVELMGSAGVIMTPAGAPFPYGKDPRDRNIRISPTFPSLPELSASVELLSICVRLAAAEKLIG